MDERPASNTVLSSDSRMISESPRIDKWGFLQDSRCSLIILFCNTTNRFKSVMSENKLDYLDFLAFLFVLKLNSVYPFMQWNQLLNYKACNMLHVTLYCWSWRFKYYLTLMSWIYACRICLKLNCAEMGDWTRWKGLLFFYLRLKTNSQRLSLRKYFKLI